VLWGLTALLLNNAVAYGDDHKIRRVLVISIDGMHALDMALFIKNNPNSTLAKLSAQGINYTNASSTRPSDSIPATVGMFTGGSPASGGMYYDDAYNRSWFAPANTTCSGTPGTVIDLKFAINASPDGVTIPGVDPSKMPRQIVNGVCMPVLPHNMMRLNTVFEIVRNTLGRTAYSEKRPSYDFLNGPSGTGVTDLFTPEINCQPHFDPNPPVAASTCTFGPLNTPGYNALLSLIDTEKFDDLRVQSVINEIDGFDHTGTQAVGVPVLFGMNFQALNAAKKDSLGGGYADDLGTPNASLADALSHTDASIGRMITELTNQGIYSTTAIIVTAKHGESSLDPSKRVIDLNSAIQKVLSTAVPPIPGIPPTGSAPGIAKLTEKTAALIWLANQTYTQAAAQVLTIKANEVSLNIAQTLSGESLKLLFPDPLTDPATPDLIVVPNLGVNFEPTLNAALPAVQAEHGGMNENETHVPLIIVGGSTNGVAINPGVIRAPVTITQIAPTILELLNLDPTALQAVRLENTGVLAGIKSDNGKSAH
jgi:predicted AlkP superfamily pyrophosphatase or phosphodiesterase